MALVGVGRPLPAHKGLEGAVFLKRVVVGGIVFRHVPGNFEQLQAATLATLQVFKRFTQSKRHLAKSMESVGLAVLADFARLVHQTRKVYSKMLGEATYRL